LPVDLEVVLPVLHFRSSDGGLDRDTTRRYATRAARTWVDRFIVSGSTARGDLLAPAQRAELLDLWLKVVQAPRLLACAWHADDLLEAEHRGIAPMAVMQELTDRHKACDFFAELPRSAYVYSHPTYSPTILDAELVKLARQQNLLPKGAKVAKTSTGEIKTIRAMAGTSFTLWDGSSRHIEASLKAGASGVVATPLSPLPTPFPQRSIATLQPAIDKLQADLDRQPSRAERLTLLIKLAHYLS